MTTNLAVGFDDLTVLSEGGADVFLLSWTLEDEPPPYYVEVAGRRFGFTQETFLIKGHSATLSRWIREQEEAGRLPLLVEREGRYLKYVHDPNETDEGE